jgi:hypothetical protein
VFLSVFQGFEAAPDRPGGIHRDKYEYRIGWGPEKADWLLRYEFLENPVAEYGGQYVYANSHFHINAVPSKPDFLPGLGEKHFPTQKMWLEEVVLGMLVDVVRPRVLERRGDETRLMKAIDETERRLARLAASS